MKKISKKKFIISAIAGLAIVPTMFLAVACGSTPSIEGNTYNIKDEATSSWNINDAFETYITTESPSPMSLEDFKKWYGPGDGLIGEGTVKFNAEGEGVITPTGEDPINFTWTQNGSNVSLQTDEESGTMTFNGKIDGDTIHVTYTMNFVDMYGQFMGIDNPSAYTCQYTTTFDITLAE